MPFAELDAAVDKIARKLADSPHVAIENIKAGLNEHLQKSLAAALEFEAVNQNACFHSPDFVEGVTAFVEKRRPIFNQKRKNAEV